MKARDAAESIVENGADEGHEATDRFRSRAALVIAVLAGLLALCDLGGDNSKDAMIHNNIKASDSWAFYQAKNQRQTMLKLAVDDLTRQSASPAAGPAEKAALQADIAQYQATIARYESEPDPAAPDDATRGEGKKQLMALAKSYEQAREVASQKNDSFDYAQVLLQLAVVLGSVAILAVSRPLLWICGGLGVVGAVFLANGFWMLFPLPF